MSSGDNAQVGFAKRALVTGGAGFLGSHLCRRLIQLGFDVLCVDNFYTGVEDNIRDLMPHARFELLRHDISSALHVEVDYIYNMACPASPIHYQYDPVRTTTTIVQGAMNMLELARRTGATLLQASTSEVYGDALEHPQTEQYWGNVNPIGPRSCYDEGKRCAETLFFDYHRQHDVAIKVARIFNTYGPGMRADDGRVVSNFIVQALRGADLTLYGDGTQTRSFCYVDDLIGGLIALMHSARAITGPINLGNPSEITMQQLARRIIALTGSASRIVTRPLPKDDPTRRCPAIRRAQTQLNWTPEISLDEGLKRTIAYFGARGATRRPVSPRATGVRAAHGVASV